MKDFFISYNRHDQQWADWLAWTLEEAGYTIVLQTWNFRSGGNFALDMNRAVQETKATIAVLSETFLQSDYTAPEWAAAFTDFRNLERKLIPLRVGACQPTGLLAQVAYINLLGVSEELATSFFLGKVQTRIKTTPKPLFPSSVLPKQILSTFEFDIITVDASGRETERRKGQSQVFTEALSDKVLLEMVSVPGDSFPMGSLVGEVKRKDNEETQRLVTVSACFVGKYEITQAQWRLVASLPKINHDLDPDPSDFKGKNRPIERVSRLEAVEFCDRLSHKTGRTYRLPREEEWEYTCRAGTQTPFHFGDSITSVLANYNGNYAYAAAQKGQNRGCTTAVGSFAPNAFGLYDMHGNVWEWCANGSMRGGSMRGGSWHSHAADCRSASRYNATCEKGNDIGFRVVCDTWTL